MMNPFLYKEWPACSSSTPYNGGRVRIKQLRPTHIFFWYCDLIDIHNSSRGTSNAAVFVVVCCGLTTISLAILAVLLLLVLKKVKEKDVTSTAKTPRVARPGVLATVGRPSESRRITP
ncbi:hypothetical protein NECAME_08163 [Necator americanus]|uniref:Uncharacterized protein n=1 Tax=Necator americanus TaxID=51031 RepID=W2TJY5_NECAM|nr:hypothetical protein NECAME_08163 [Necator americanus]ETN82113.1 hypothetical protein NECAME_08163 [Necator americanus]